MKHAIKFTPHETWYRHDTGYITIERANWYAPVRLTCGHVCGPACACGTWTAFTLRDAVMCPSPAAQ